MDDAKKLYYVIHLLCNVGFLQTMERPGHNLEKKKPNIEQYNMVYQIK